MTLTDFKELLGKYDVKTQNEPKEDMQLIDLGIDSVDILMVLGDIEDRTGKAFDLTFDQTLGELLKKITEAGG